MRRTLAFGHLVARPWRIPADEAAGAMRNLARSPGFEATLEAIGDHAFGGHTLDCPVTVAWGEKDRLLIYSRQSARARRLLPDARHVTLHGCGHVPTWDDPEQVARVLLEGQRESSRGSGTIQSGVAEVARLRREVDVGVDERLRSRPLSGHEACAPAPRRRPRPRPGPAGPARGPPARIMSGPRRHLERLARAEEVLGRTSTTSPSRLGHHERAPASSASLSRSFMCQAKRWPSSVQCTSPG